MLRPDRVARTQEIQRRSAQFSSGGIGFHAD
jgi:hypothetical protein